MIQIVEQEYNNSQMQISSDIYQSKFSGYSISEHHQMFLTICDQMQVLEEMRIVQKLARPTSLPQKEQLMRNVNKVLSFVEGIMKQIQKLSSLFKGKEVAVVKEQSVTSGSWKNGVRRVQTKINNFYQQKMGYFNMVNQYMNLNLRLIRLYEKDWAKDCLSRMGPFCICG